MQYSKDLILGGTRKISEASKYQKITYKSMKWKKLQINKFFMIVDKNFKNKEITTYWSDVLIRGIEQKMTL